MGPLQKNLPIEEGAALIAYAAKLGVNFVDTAEYYQTYPYIKRALAEAPNLVVMTKSYAYDRDGALRDVEAAQEGIGREKIDIFLMHEQESEHTLRGHREAFETYLRLRGDGVIGQVGISAHHVAAVRAAAKWPGMDVVFPLINRTGLGICDGTREEMEQAILSCHEKGIAVIAMKALGGGHLIGDRETALRYAMDLPGISAVAVGMQSFAEIEYNASLFAGRRPSAKSAEESAGAPRTLLVQDWCEGCGRCVERCGQRAMSLVDGKAKVDAAKCVRCGYCAGVCPQFCLKVV